MAGSFKDLIVYQKAIERVTRIFEVTKAFPKSEQFSLTDQIRRLSRSVCVNFAESWRKRRYIAHFVSKLTDAHAEASEKTVWLDFSLKCGYLDEQVHRELSAQYDEIDRMLGSTIASPQKFCSEFKKQGGAVKIKYLLLTAGC